MTAPGSGEQIIQNTFWGWKIPASPARAAQECTGHCPGSGEATAEELLLGFGIFPFSFSPPSLHEQHTAAAAPAEPHLREQVASSALLSLAGFSLSPIIPGKWQAQRRGG